MQTNYNLQWELYTQLNETAPPVTAQDVQTHFNIDKPRLVAIDTETTGLNITVDKPFLLVVAWKVPNSNKGKSFTLTWDAKAVSGLLKMFSTCRFIIGANIKYDLHMLRNGGAPFPFEIINERCELTDIRILRRLTMETDASFQDEKMALKQMSVKFIDPNANQDEHIVKDLLRKQNLVHRKIIKEQLKPLGYKLKDVEDKINDCRYGIEALPPEVQTLYNNWEGNATYYDVYKLNPYSMNKYAAMDGVFTIELFLLFWSDYERYNIKYNNSLVKLFEQENKLIRLYYKQETVGIKIDIEYLKQARIKLAKYLLTLQKELNTLCGEEVSENQHKQLLRIFQTKFHVPEEFFLNRKTGKITFDKAILKKLIKSENPQVRRVALVISKLRRCRKWAGTYVDSIYKIVLANGDGRLHPNTNQVGTVSGRVSGDMQQIPRDVLYDLDGNEIYHPRKMIKPSGDDFPLLVLQDFDQMEFRVQAHYTLQYGVDDINMCRMFIPYGYRHYQTQELFNIDLHKLRTQEQQENGQSVWVLNNQPWVPVDPHGMHVISAFGYNETHPDYKHLRNCAKTINFASMYGSGLKGLLDNTDLEEYPAETITKIYEAFKGNFSGVDKYQKIVNNYVKANGYIPNIYGRVYRVNYTNRGYKCANYLIQGSCADLVKQALVEIDKLLVHHNAKSRMLYTIHDEIMWELHKDEAWLIPEVEKVLNKVSGWCKIPLTCGTDLTHTNWAEKQDIKNYL